MKFSPNIQGNIKRRQDDQRVKGGGKVDHVGVSTA